MTSICVLGAQWGDEGKGKIIDLLAERADIVARFGGGNNAGHTVVVKGRRFAVHLLPAGILREGVVNVIGNGVVVDPWHLNREIADIRSGGIRIVPGENLHISRCSHLILPIHRMQDRVMEELRGKGKIGTTGRGIGPAYQDRASRAGVRFGDLADRDHLSRRLHATVEEKNRFLTSNGLAAVDPDTVMAELLEVTQDLLPAASDTGLFLRRALKEGKRILFEGSQGLLLDVDLGTYPYVTSTSVGAGGVGGGAAVPPRALDQVVAVAKAYTTRVGEGPFPTELRDATGDLLREQGREYGTTTGRPRRCGWFDAVATRYAVEVSGADALYLTKFDVLSGFPEVKIGIAYRRGNDVMRDFPAGMPGLDQVSVEYLSCPGWDADLTGVRRYDDLPSAARDYVSVLEDCLGVPIPLISVGPDRDQVIFREHD